MGRHNAFTFPYTFFRERAAAVIPQLMDVGFTGINLALNYHASRDFLLRQGPALEYLQMVFTTTNLISHIIRVVQLRLIPLIA